MKQFMELLGQQGMKEQSQDFMEVLQYIAGMQLQLSAMVDELQGVRKQLERMQESQPKAAESQLLDKVSYLQEKVSSLAERLSELKDHLIDTAAQAVTAFKEKGREEMNRVLQKGISGVQSVLSGCREKMVDVLTSYEKDRQPDRQYRGRVQADREQRSQRGKALNRKRYKGSVGRKRGRCPYKGTEYACKEAYLSLKETGGAD